MRQATLKNKSLFKRLFFISSFIVFGILLSSWKEKNLYAGVHPKEGLFITIPLFFIFSGALVGGMWSEPEKLEPKEREDLMKIPSSQNKSFAQKLPPTEK